ncbi:hypothetical protein Tco_1047740, partial [Tanacetum coccineum]
RNYQEESFTRKEEMAPMALSDSEVTTCSKSCLKNYAALKKQYDDLRIELNQSEFNLANYKRGLASVEERLVFYKKNEGMLYDQIAVLKRDASFNESEINALKIQIERLKKEKESNQFKFDNFENASKSLDKLIGSQISDNNRKGVGYNAVAPPPTGLFAPPTIDLSSSGLKEFQQPEFEGYGLRVNKSVCENSSNETKKNSDAPLIEEWVSDNEDEVKFPVVIEKKNVVPTIPKVDVVRLKQQEKSVRKTVRTNRVNSVKASACWVWRPIKPNSASITLKRYDYVDGNPEIELEDSVRLNSPEDKKNSTSSDTLRDMQPSRDTRTQSMEILRCQISTHHTMQSIDSRSLIQPTIDPNQERRTGQHTGRNNYITANDRRT